MSNFDLRKYLAEGRLLKEVGMEASFLPVDPVRGSAELFSSIKNELMASGEEIINKIPKDQLMIMKSAAEKILAKKLCSCIKKVGPANEPRAIGVCTKAVINRKGLSRGKFKCKNGRSVELKKTARKLTVPKTKGKPKTKTQKKR